MQRHSTTAHTNLSILSSAAFFGAVLEPGCCAVSWLVMTVEIASFLESNGLYLQDFMSNEHTQTDKKTGLLALVEAKVFRSRYRWIDMHIGLACSGF